MHTTPSPVPGCPFRAPGSFLGAPPAEFPLVWQIAHWSTRVHCYASHVMQTLAENPPCDRINRSCIVCHLTHNGCICVSAIDRVNQSAWEEDRWRTQPPVRKRRLTLAKRLAAPARIRTSRPAAFIPRNLNKANIQIHRKRTLSSPGARGEELRNATYRPPQSLSKELALLLISDLCLYGQPSHC
jgi:hypothetical protein